MPFDFGKEDKTDQKTGGFDQGQGSTAFGAPAGGFGFKGPLGAGQPANTTGQGQAIGFGFGGPKTDAAGAQPAKPAGFGTFGQTAGGATSGFPGFGGPKPTTTPPAGEKSQPEGAAKTDAPAAEKPKPAFTFQTAQPSQQKPANIFATKAEEQKGFFTLQPAGDAKTPEQNEANKQTASVNAPQIPSGQAAVDKPVAAPTAGSLGFGKPAEKPAAVSKPFVFGGQQPAAQPVAKDEVKKLETPAPAPAAPVTAVPQEKPSVSAPAQPQTQPKIQQPDAKAEKIPMTEEEQTQLEQKYKLKKVIDLKMFELPDEEELLKNVEFQVKKACADFVQNVTEQITQQIKQIIIQLPPQAMAVASPIAQQDNQTVRQLAKMEAELTHYAQLVKDMQLAKLQTSQLQGSQILSGWTPEHKMIMAGCGAVLLLLILVIAIKK